MATNSSTKREIKILVQHDELKLRLMLPANPGSSNETSWENLMNELSRRDDLKNVVNSPTGSVIIEIYDPDLEEFVLLDKQLPIGHLSKIRIVTRGQVSAPPSIVSSHSSAALSAPSSATVSPSPSPIPQVNQIPASAPSPKESPNSRTPTNKSVTSNFSTTHNESIPGPSSIVAGAPISISSRSLKEAILNSAFLQPQMTQNHIDGASKSSPIPPPPSPSQLSSAIPLEVIEALNGKDEKFRKYILSVYKKEETTRALNQALLLCLVEKCDFYVSGCQWNEEQIWNQISADVQQYINRNRSSGNQMKGSGAAQATPVTKYEVISSSKCKEAFVKILLLYKRILHEASNLDEARCLWPKYMTILDKSLIRGDLLSKIGLGEREINAIIGQREKFHSVSASNSETLNQSINQPTSSNQSMASSAASTDIFHRSKQKQKSSPNESTGTRSSDQRTEALNEDLIIKRFWGKRDYYLDENLDEEQIWDELATDMIEFNLEPLKCRELFIKNVLKYIAVLESAGSLKEAHRMWPDYFLIMDKIITGRCILNKIGFTHQQLIGIFSLKRGLMERMEKELKEKLRQKGRSDKQSRKAFLNIKIRTLLEFVRHKLVYEPDSWSNLEEFWESISQELNRWDLESTATEAQYLFENQIVIYFERLRKCGSEKEAMKGFQHFHFIHTHLANQATLTTLGLSHYIEQMEGSRRVFYERQFPALGQEPNKKRESDDNYGQVDGDSDIDSLNCDGLSETDSETDSDTGSSHEKSSTCSSGGNSLKMSLFGDVLANLRVK